MRPLTNEERKWITTLGPDRLRRLTHTILKVTRKPHPAIPFVVIAIMRDFLEEARHCGAD